MYIGRYYHQLEEKGRVSLPKKFREKEKNTFVITRGLDGGLFLYPESEWTQSISELSQKADTKKKHRDFVRLMTNDAQEVSADKLGRITIPDYLKTFAKVKKELVIVGSYNKIEIWDVATYHAYIEKIEQEAEEIAESIETPA